MYRFFYSLFILFLGISLYSQEYKPVEEAYGLAVGSPAPLFSALDADSLEYSLQEALSEGPVVMIFFRGYWCPVCNRHLSKVQDSLVHIYERGASVIAVSPEKPVYLQMTREKTGSEFRLLYDKAYKISDAYDVAFLPTRWQLRRYNTFMGANLMESHSDDSQRLPIPATYIINTDGRIKWRQFDRDYHNRSMVSDIVAALKEL
jgi:peroxiredoxin